MTIPKKIYQSWYTRDLPKEVNNKINRMLTLNPSYSHEIFTDEEMDDFVNKYYPGEIAECYNKLNIIVAKVDFWRYLILYKYGGIYLDMDSEITRSLDEFIRDDDEAIITSEGHPPCFVQWGLIFNKGHPILKKTIELVVDNIKTNRYPKRLPKGGQVLWMTGPHVYTRAVNAVHEKLYDQPIDRLAINRETNVTYQKDGISYRLYGIDYKPYFRFKHSAARFLYANKKPWREVLHYTPLIIRGATARRISETEECCAPSKPSIMSFTAI